jgi:dTDP-4-amino-4,6-dideoxygalactose transaminase
MWPRKQLDVGWSELAFGLWQCVAGKPQPSTEEVVGPGWIASDEAVVSLSVRSGWDLFLATHRFPAGSEIITTAVTIPDMVRIIEHHGLVAVPVAIDPDRLEPSLDDIERAITPRTRAILVAHLFGARVDMGPIIRLAREHDLLVIEDCAQAFIGREYAGHDETDCSLFSFGPIKTATSLGGALLRIRDAAIRRQIIERQQSYPVQTHRAYFSRLAKYTLFRILAWPWLFGLIVRGYRLCGADYDRKLGNAAHSFPGAEFFIQIRRQPCAALLRLLQYRLATFDARAEPQLRRRTTRGQQLAKELPAGMIVGGENETHTYWVMPLRVANVSETLSALNRAGFDATSRSSLVVVPPPADRNGNERSSATWLAETIFLPNGHDIPDSEWKRVAIILRNIAQAPASAATPVAPTASREPAPKLRVSVSS